MTRYEAIIDSHGLPVDVTEYVLETKNSGLPKLEMLAFEAALNVICHGHFNMLQLRHLPASVMSGILSQISQRRIPCTPILLKLLSHPLRTLDLTNYIPSSLVTDKNVQNSGATAATPYVTQSMVLTISKYQINLQSLVLCDNTSLTDEMLIPIKDLKLLTFLSLSGCVRLTDKLFLVVRELINLRKLSLSRINKITSQGVFKLWSSPDGILEYIDLSYTSVKEDPYENVFKALTHHCKLSTLKVDGVKNLRYLRGLENLQGLTHLSLKELNLDPEAITHVTELTLLEELDLREVEIPLTEIQPLFNLPLLRILNMSLIGDAWKMTQNMTSHFLSATVTSINFANNKWINDDVLNQLTSNLICLLELDISNTDVTSACLSISLHRLKHLQVLGAQGVPLNDEDMAVLGELRELKKLNLSDTGLADEFLMAEYLNALKSLELLSMCRCMFTDAGLVHLKICQLQTLWLDGCAVSLDTAFSLADTNCKNLTYLSLRFLKILTDDDHEDDDGDELQGDDVLLVD